MPGAFSYGASRLRNNASAGQSAAAQPSTQHRPPVDADTAAAAAAVAKRPSGGYLQEQSRVPLHQRSTAALRARAALREPRPRPRGSSPVWDRSPSRHVTRGPLRARTAADLRQLAATDRGRSPGPGHAGRDTQRDSNLRRPRPRRPLPRPPQAAEQPGLTSSSNSGSSAPARQAAEGTPSPVPPPPVPTAAHTAADADDDSRLRLLRREPQTARQPEPSPVPPASAPPATARPCTEEDDAFYARPGTVDLNASTGGLSARMQLLQQRRDERKRRSRSMSPVLPWDARGRQEQRYDALSSMIRSRSAFSGPASSLDPGSSPSSPGHSSASGSAATPAAVDPDALSRSCSALSEMWPESAGLRDLAAQLRELAGLRRDGQLTPSEYAEAKSAVIRTAASAASTGRSKEHATPGDGRTPAAAP